MKNFFLLVRLYLRESLDTRKAKANGARSHSFTVFIVLMGALFLLLSSVYNIAFASAFTAAGADVVNAAVAMGGIATFMVLSTAIVRAKSIFVAKDYEMLRALPIKKRDIVASKIVGLYLIELLYSAILLVPNGVCCAVFSGNLWHIPSCLVLALLVPALPIAVGCLFGALVALIADRSRFGNIFSTLVYIAFFAGIFFFSYTIGGTVGSLGAEGGSASFSSLDVFGYCNPTLSFVRKAFTENPLWYLAFIACNILILAAAVAFIALLFDKVYAVANSRRASGKYKAKRLKSRKQFSTLFFHEVKRYFSSRVYCVNTIMSGVFSVILVAILSVSLSELSASFAGAEQAGLTAAFRDYSYFGALAIMFTIGMSTPASVSISIEGSCFWIVKTLPIRYRTLAKAKILLSVAVLGVFSLISSVLVIIFFKPDVFGAVTLIAAPLLYVVGMSSFGLWLNLGHYKLKWKNEAEVVKNSAAVIVAMLAEMAMEIGISAASVVAGIFNRYLGMGVLLALCLVLAVVFYVAALKAAERKIHQIEDF